MRLWVVMHLLPLPRAESLAAGYEAFRKAAAPKQSRRLLCIPVLTMPTGALETHRCTSRWDGAWHHVFACAPCNGKVDAEGD